MRHRIFTRTAALAVALCAVAAPTAAASGPVPPPPSSIAASAGSAYQDLRSTDPRDADPSGAEGRETFYVSDPGTQGTSPGPSDGLDWGDAGIGAGGLLGLILLGLGSTLIVMHRKHRGRGQPATTG
jgi:hypothetical protein